MKSTPCASLNFFYASMYLYISLNISSLCREIYGYRVSERIIKSR